MDIRRREHRQLLISERHAGDNSRLVCRYITPLAASDGVEFFVGQQGSGMRKNRVGIAKIQEIAELLPVCKGIDGQVFHIINGNDPCELLDFRSVRNCRGKIDFLGIFKDLVKDLFVLFLGKC